jgi:hypothetical protein
VHVGQAQRIRVRVRGEQRGERIGRRFLERGEIAQHVAQCNKIQLEVVFGRHGLTPECRAVGVAAKG